MLRNYNNEYLIRLILSNHHQFDKMLNKTKSYWQPWSQDFCNISSLYCFSSQSFGLRSAYTPWISESQEENFKRVQIYVKDKYLGIFTSKLGILLQTLGFYFKLWDFTSNPKRIALNYSTRDFTLHFGIIFANIGILRQIQGITQIGILLQTSRF